MPARSPRRVREAPSRPGAPRESLVDREQEQAELVRLRAQAQLRGRPIVALLTGRRRVGKTFLLTHAWPSEQLFFFTASRATPEINRRQLVLDFAAWTGEALDPDDYPTWRTVCQLLLSRGRATSRGVTRARVVVLDEFQYLAEGESGLAQVASELNAVLEQRADPSSPRPVLLILAGSAVATMEALAAGGAPLYGRFAWRYRLAPFTYWHAAKFADFRALRDRAVAYAIFGGTPRYLAAVDTSRSLSQNVIDLFLSPHGELRSLLETALDQEEGLRDANKYRALLGAVSNGCTARNDIAQRVGLANDHALREKLATLVDLGYLDARANVDAKANEATRYAIADPAVRFYHRFVVPNASALARYPGARVWEVAIAPHLDTFMGPEFERMAAQAYDRVGGMTKRPALPLVERWARWEGVDRARRSLEIDIVAPLVDGGVMTGAVKWNRAPVGVGVHHQHMDMLRRAADAGRAWAHAALEGRSPLYYVAAGGFSQKFQDAVEASGHAYVCWGLGDVYRDDRGK